MIKLLLQGTPKAKQSFRYTKSGIKYQPKEITDNSKSLKLQIKEQLPKGFELFSEPLHVDYVFYYPHLKTKSKRTIYKATKPDIDNLQKQINDAMNGLVYKDDSLIVSITARKTYAETGYIKVFIETI